MSDRKRHRTLAEIRTYLEGKLPGRERHAFERDMQADPFLQEAMEGLDTLSNEELEADLQLLQGKLNRRMKRRRRIAFYSAAAAIASLLIVTTLFIKLNDFSPEESSRMMTEQSSRQDSMTTEEKTTTEERVEKESPEEEEGTSDRSQGKTRSPDAMPEENKSAEPQAPVVSRDYEPAGKASTEREAASRSEELVVMEAEAREKGAAISDAAATEDQEAALETIEEVFAHDEASVQIEKIDAKAMTGEKALPGYQEEMAAGKQEDLQYEALSAESRSAKRRSPSLFKQVADDEEAAQAAPEPYAGYERMISGRVVSSEDSMPLPGATIVLRGSGQGVAAGPDGKFYIPYAGDSAPTLTASFVGMESLEYDVVDEQEVLMALHPDLSVLSEVVVVGSGVSNVSYDETGSATTIEVSDQPGSASYVAAKPDGGHRAFTRYIEKNILVPESQVEEKRVVILRLTVSAEGELKDIAVLKSPGEAHTTEARRLIEEGPDWIAAERDGVSIEETMNVRIVFKR